MRASSLLLAAGLSLALAFGTGGPSTASSVDTASESCPPSECFGWFGAPPGPLVNHSEMVEALAADPLRGLPVEKRVELLERNATWLSGQPAADAPLMVALAAPVGQVQGPWSWVYAASEPYGVCNPQCTYVGSARTAARISLNGRASRWNQTIQAFEGGRIRGRLWYNCVAENGVAPSTSCSDGWQIREDSRYTTEPFGTSDQIYHRDADTYRYEFRFGVRPEEYPQYPSQGPEHSSFGFVCPRANGNCRF